jgi:GNAT superfamily N-acetyltransferase
VHFGGDRRDAAQYDIYGGRAPLVRANDELIASLRPASPHWYLDTLATDPERFGEGLAGRLIDHGLAIRDANGESVALDVHLERNRRFYERWGFEAIASGRLPGEDLELTIMLREPAASAASS